MPARSKAQQRLFGMARGVQKGTVSAKRVGPAVRRIAKTVSPASVRDVAQTKRANLAPYVTRERAMTRFTSRLKGKLGDRPI